jgi:hypothetical protein
MTKAAAILAVIVGFASAARAQWPADASSNLAIGDGPGDQVVEKLALAPDGSCYVSWFDNASGNYDVRLQHLSPAGVALWPHNGILVSNKPQNSSLVDWDLIADSLGNAIVTFTDIRFGPDLDVYAYKFDSTGAPLWGPDGIALSADSDFEANPRVAETTDGDFVFVWSRSPNVGDGHIVMQRLAANGTPKLAANGVNVAGETGKSPAFARVVAADNGNVVVSWVRDIKSFTSQRFVRAEKFDATGVSVWGAPVSVYDAASVPIGYEPKLLSDLAGGAILVWHASVSNLFNSLVQHLSAGGLELFPHNGVAVSTTPNMHHLDPSGALNTSTGEIFVFWNERNSAQSAWGIFGQKFSSGGSQLWGAGGLVVLPVNTVNKILPQTVAYADGAMEFHLQDSGGPPNTYTVIGHRLDGNGNKVWLSGSPLVVSSVASNKARLTPRSDASGFVRLVWEDNRNPSTDIYGAGVLAGGTLGSPGLTPYGTGTPGCSGPSNVTAALLPNVGQLAFAFLGDNAPPSSLGLCLVTDSQDYAGSDPFGLGVLLHVDFFFANEVFGLDMPIDATGNGVSPAPIPPSPFLAGKSYYAQTLLLWSGPCSLPPFGLSSSRGLQVTILP